MWAPSASIIAWKQGTLHGWSGCLVIFWQKDQPIMANRRGQGLLSFADRGLFWGSRVEFFVVAAVDPETEALSLEEMPTKLGIS
jgi:hypothetical protein